jgi:hypothetical protein
MERKRDLGTTSITGCEDRQEMRERERVHQERTSITGSGRVRAAGSECG